MPFTNGQTGYIGELLDVFTGGGATTGQFLMFDGHDWTQSNTQPFLLGDSLDVTTGGGAKSGEYLKWNGQQWVPSDTSSFNNLSERVFNLEIEQALRPTNQDINIAVGSVSARFNTLKASNDAQQDTIDLLVRGFASIKKSFNDLDNLFATHTGVSGAHNL